MQTEACEAIWSEIAHELRVRVGGDRYDRWLMPLKLVEVGQVEARLGVPNRFWQEWIESRYLRDIEESLKRRLGREVQVKVHIDPELFCQLRRSQRKILADLQRRSPEESDPSEGGAAAGAAESGPAHHPQPLPPRERGAERETLESFVVGPANRMAYTAARAVAEAPGSIYNPLFIHGPSGMGKTHLLKGIRAELNRREPSRPARYLTGEEFLNRFVASLKAGTIGRFRDHHRASQVMLIDDIQLLGNKHRTQEEFLHTFNALADAGHQIVIASDSHPRTIGNLQKPLMGRFIAGLVVKVGRPDFETRLLIVREWARPSRAGFREEVLSLLAQVVRSNVRELLGGFNVLEAHTLEDGRELDPAAAQKILLDTLEMGDQRFNLQGIVERVASHFSVPVQGLVSASRQRSLTRVRQVAMYLGRKYTGRSLAEIGKFFGGRNHTSVKSAGAKVERLLQVNPALAKDIESIIDSFEA